MSGTEARPLLLDTHIFAWWLLDSPRLLTADRAFAGLPLAVMWN